MKKNSKKRYDYNIFYNNILYIIYMKSRRRVRGRTRRTRTRTRRGRKCNCKKRSCKKKGCNI